MMDAAIDCSAILVVDDDKDIRESLSEILEDEGYVVSGVTNGAEALAYLRSTKMPCVILLDLMMPVMDGWQFRSEQLRDATLSQIPVIVLSANGNVAQQAASMQAMECLSKPVRLNQLLSAVGRVCEPLSQ